MEQSHKGGIYECCVKSGDNCFATKRPREHVPALAFRYVFLHITHKAEAIARFDNILRHLQVFG